MFYWSKYFDRWQVATWMSVSKGAADNYVRTISLKFGYPGGEELLDELPDGYDEHFINISNLKNNKKIREFYKPEEKPPKKLLLLPAKTEVIDEKPEKEERVEEDFVDDRIKFNPPPDVIYILPTDKVPEEEITQPLPPIKPEPPPDEPKKPEEDKPETSPDKPPPDGPFIPPGDRRGGQPPPQLPQTPVETGPERDNTRLFGILTVVITIGFILFTGLWAVNRFTRTPPPPPRTATPTSQIIPLTLTPTIELTKTITPTPTISPTSTISPTPTVSPTPVPFPINENFSDDYSDLWWVHGSPIVVGSMNLSKNTGLLTAMEGEMATMVIGNVGWDDYVISLGYENITIESPSVQLAFRYIDVNNMILLDCDFYSQCTWYFVVDGVRNKIIETGHLYFSEGGTITVNEDRISIDVVAYDDKSSITIPDIYKEKFSNGGFMITFQSGTYFDYINIQELP